MISYFLYCKKPVRNSIRPRLVPRYESDREHEENIMRLGVAFEDQLQHVIFIDI